MNSGLSSYRQKGGTWNERTDPRTVSTRDTVSRFTLPRGRTRVMGLEEEDTFWRLDYLSCVLSIIPHSRLGGTNEETEAHSDEDISPPQPPSSDATLHPTATLTKGWGFTLASVPSLTLHSCRTPHQLLWGPPSRLFSAVISPSLSAPRTRTLICSSHSFLPTPLEGAFQVTHQIPTLPCLKPSVLG